MTSSVAASAGSTVSNLEVEALPVMLHPSRALDAKAIAVPGMRIVTPPCSRS
ncbi:hypothetical protein [Streptomyces violaceus]|uniref:Uncharacterized protein n=1 Tax=Streptomyces violaceus TaxID=1936 RepID=A0ABY9TZV7_STRVL|nr:hypothetical protein [Streptomyces janthinus]WND15865.1 hypothetical protein RI060_00040 [Streptomyces janthinus]